jgi:hypothetical protein
MICSSFSAQNDYFCGKSLFFMQSDFKNRSKKKYNYKRAQVHNLKDVDVVIQEISMK